MIRHWSLVIGEFTGHCVIGHWSFSAGGSIEEPKSPTPSHRRRFQGGKLLKPFLHHFCTISAPVFAPFWKTPVEYQALTKKTAPSSVSLDKPIFLPNIFLPSIIYFALELRSVGWTA